MSEDKTQPVEILVPEGELLDIVPLEDNPNLKGPIWKVVSILLLVGVTGMVFAVALQIIARWTGMIIPWTEELSRFLFMGVCFLGLAAGFRTAAHPRVTFLLAKSPEWLKKAINHLYVLLGLLFFTIITWKSAELILQQIANRETSPALAIGMFWVTLPLFIGSILSIVAIVRSIYLDPELSKRVRDGEIIA